MSFYSATGIAQWQIHERSRFRTAYEAKYFDIKMSDGTAMMVQDRAYTSPIWDTPAN